mmetsp:Transcript_27656/g.83261  ORF Transcript_27656/g.83261 Transcript_27656/m.83261 type:complete len:220 (+) Transcript_27656:202-861(+)
MIVPEACRCCGQPVAATRSGAYVLVRRSLKYELSKTRGRAVHAPSKPERSALQPPTVWAPLKATMSRSLKPFGWKISRRCGTPLSPSGSRPSWEATDSAALAASTRPKRVGIRGPPMASVATFAASAQRSAWEIAPGATYLSATGASSPMATSRPAFASKAPSPASRKRWAAFGQPPFSAPLEKTPASCHESRMRIAPQFFAATSSRRSATMASAMAHT